MTIRGKSILIIDDDAAMLRALHRVLSGEGAVVTNASWAGEAMEHLTDKFEHFDLIITDLRMPILGGQTILGAVTTALPQVPVIIITAFATPELKTECLHRGATAFLEKPLNTSELLKAVEDALSLKKSSLSRRAWRRKRLKNTSFPASGPDTDLFDPKPGVMPGAAR